MTSARGPARDQVVYSRLETDAEMLARATAVAGHRTHHSCCGRTVGALLSTDQIAEAHSVTRRIVEVVPPLDDARSWGGGSTKSWDGK